MIKKIAAVILTLCTLWSVPYNSSVSANTKSEKRQTWKEVEEYCRKFIGDLIPETCADYVSKIMKNCAFYPGSFTQQPRAKAVRQMLRDNEYQLVASNTAYRTSVGLDMKTAVSLSDWVASHAKKGDILVWVRNSSKDIDNTGCSHISIYCGNKKNMKAYKGQTTWPSHYSDKGAGGKVVLETLWQYMIRCASRGEGCGIYIYRKPGVTVKYDDPGTWGETGLGKEFYNLDGIRKVSEFAEIFGKIYYFDTEGFTTSGLQKIGSKYYYFNEDGTMHIGWKLIDGKWYLFDNKGRAVTGWAKAGKKWYYMDSDYVMQTGFITLEGKNYYLHPDGDMASDEWITVDGKEYYYNEDGTQAFKQLAKYKTLGKQDDGKTYYTYRYLGADGTPVSGWKTVKNRKYYFDEEDMSSPSFGVYRIGDTDYLFDAKCRLAAKGWVKLPVKYRSAYVYYYADSKGRPVTGWKKYKGQMYYLVPEKGGRMAVGTTKIGDKTYYFKKNGEMITGWKKIKGKWYWFKGDGSMTTSAKIKINGRKYKFDGEGICLNP